MTTVTTTKFIAYKTNLGLILKHDNGYYPSKIGDLFLFDDQKASELNNNWWLVHAQEVKELKKLKPSQSIQTSWKRKEEIPVGLNIPDTLDMQQLQHSWSSDSECYVYSGEYSSIGSMYNPVMEVQEATWEVVPFEITVLRNLDVQGISDPVKMQIRINNDQNYCNSKGLQEVDLKSITTWDELEKILTPEFLLHERPCELSSTSMYNIVRTHIQQNLDRTKCKITSDYAFCFTVKRLVKVQPYSVRKEVYKSLFKSYNPPKFKNETVQVKEVECFEMTHNKADNLGGYNGYTVIPALKARNLKELSEYLKQYLDDLITELNTPVEECQHCKGTGHIVHQIKHPKGGV